jgi:hypothetical protein
MTKPAYWARDRLIRLVDCLASIGPCSAAAARVIRRFDPCVRGYCLGNLVSGRHDGKVWVGWRCEHCGKVFGYEPAPPFLKDFLPTKLRSH